MQKVLVSAVTQDGLEGCILSFAIVKSGAVAVQDDGCGRIKMDEVGRLKTSAIDTWHQSHSNRNYNGGRAEDHNRSFSDHSADRITAVRVQCVCGE